ncbi:Rib/alpha-like domain-containing protein [Gardnerella vaginalis]|uniref:Rib/alpha-like domain-containing protein n=1 Tax=Gardnerella sp. DNF01195 TaxID=2749065 RepID=UPI001571CD99|nr:peptidase [Gardnerella vaginalis]NSX45070.1 peptidase [Gardnerella vaginalis]
MRKVSTIHTISGIVLAFGLIVSSLIYVPSLATTAVAEETSPIHTPLTAQTAHDISTGRIRLENNQIDSLLYHKAALDPDQDSDGDGLKNSEELYTYVKNGRTYYGYNSHPLIKDTDGDGLDDKNDNNPRRWDISPRDMALFMELVYREDSYVKEVLDYSKPLTKIYKNRNEYKLMHNELAPFWKVKETYHFGSGFDAILFENVNPAYPFIEQNGVQVLAIRGTESGGDFTNDIKLAIGLNPSQALDVNNVMDKINREKLATNLYITGHSLGGYLSQRALIYAKQKNYQWITKAYTFNAPRIKGNIFNKWLWETSDFGDQLTKEGYAVHYKVDNDKVIGPIGNLNGAISIGRSGEGHGSRSYFEPRMDSFEGFTVGERNKIEGTGRKIAALDGLVNEPVIKTDEQSFEPKIENIDIFENDKLPKVTDYLLNASDRPQGSTITDITDKTSINTSKSGKYEGKILLALSDNSVKTIIVPIIIHKRLANIEELPNVTAEPGKKIEVKKDNKIPDNFDFKPYLKNLPENSTVQVVKQPNTTNTGETTFIVEITFANKAKQKVTLKAHVVEIIPATPLNPAKKLIPGKTITPIPNVTAEPGKKIEVKKDNKIPDNFDFKPYLKNLPENSTVQVVKQPNTTNTGETTFIVEITFANKAKQKVTLKAHVVEIIPATPLNPAKKSITWAELIPAKKSTPWTELTPATPAPTPTPVPPTPVPPTPEPTPSPTPTPTPDQQPAVPLQPKPNPVNPTPVPPKPAPKPEPQPVPPTPESHSGNSEHSSNGEPDKSANSTTPQTNKFDQDHKEIPSMGFPGPTHPSKTLQTPAVSNDSMRENHIELNANSESHTLQQQIPSAPKSIADLLPALCNTLTVGNNNIAYAGKNNHITVTVNATSEFMRRLQLEKAVKAYAYIYSNPKLLYSANGMKYVTVHINEYGRIVFDVVIPEDYKGNHTIVLIDENGKQVAWTNTLVKKDPHLHKQSTIANNALPRTGIQIIPIVLSVALMLFASTIVTIARKRKFN